MEAEKLVGTMGGGMDQTVSCLATAGRALRIDCRGKLTATSVELPKNAAFVLASSMVGTESYKCFIFLVSPSNANRIRYIQSL